MKNRISPKSILALLILLCSVFGLMSCAYEGLNSTEDGAPKTPGGYYGEAALPSYERSDASVGGKEGMAVADGDVYYSDDSSYVPGEAGEDVAPTDPGVDEPTDPEPTDPDEPRELTKDEIQELYNAGLITAAAWNDNTYYTMWQEMFEKGQNEGEDGRFVYYIDKGWNIDARSRITVTVSCGEKAVFGAKVTAYDPDGQELCSAVTDAKGKAYLFTPAEEGTLVVSSAEAAETVAFTAEERDLAVELASEGNKKNTIELMFVVDVTGSMGDEIDYLKAELGDVIRRIAQNDSETRISLAFLFYRDDEDDVKFCYVDFRDVTNPDDYAIQQAELQKQYAMGGGDYPEAMDEALAIAVGAQTIPGKKSSVQWSAGATKMIFLVLDAPCHETKANKETFSTAVHTAAEKGIRICPVLASGADVLTEYLTRSAAIISGGTFVYITDDSGIGGSHYDPNLPNVVVERLNMLMVRLILGYHTGVFEAPIPWNVEQ